jgi:Tubulin-tyrosine ligase family
MFDLFIYNRHEIRIASSPVPTEEDAASSSDNVRDRLAHITNGAQGKMTERALLHHEPELIARNVQERVEYFVADMFANHLVTDIARRVNFSLTNDQDEDELMGIDPSQHCPIRKFALTGLDLMVTESNRIYLLEANTNPAAPPADAISEAFHNHLIGFCHDIVDMAVGKPCASFVSAGDILDRDAP